MYDDVEECFEILISITEQEKHRIALGLNLKLISYLSISFDHLCKIVKKEYGALSSLISFVSNLLISCSKIKKIVET